MSTRACFEISFEKDLVLCFPLVLMCSNGELIDSISLEKDSIDADLDLEILNFLRVDHDRATFHVKYCGF